MWRPTSCLEADPINLTPCSMDPESGKKREQEPLSVMSQIVQHEILPCDRHQVHSKNRVLVHTFMSLPVGHNFEPAQNPV
jgi:hypothetical protein